MKIAAFDVATITGVAVGEIGGNPKCWSHNLGSKGKKQSDKLSMALRLAARVIEDHEPDLVVIEASVGGAKANALLIKMSGCIEAVAANRGITVEHYYTQSIRKHFLGRVPSPKDYSGNYQEWKKQLKRLVIMRCQILGYQVDGDDNAADAAALWDYTCAKHGAEMLPSGGLFKRFLKRAT